MRQNRRSIRNFFIRPGPQLRVGAGFLVIILVLQSGILFGLRWPIQTFFDELQRFYRIDGAELQTFVISIQSTLLYASLVSLALALIAIIYGLRLSHQIYGPLVPIQRHIKSLVDGDYSSRIHLREGDEFKELEGSLNALAANLERAMPPN